MRAVSLVTGPGNTKRNEACAHLHYVGGPAWEKELHTTNTVCKARWCRFAEGLWTA